MRHNVTVNIASVWVRVRRALPVFGATIAAFLICLPAFSQGTAGRISGEVTDSNGGVVVGATVTVLDAQRGTTRTLTTDSAGAYSAPNLIPSTYTVSAAIAGFKTAQQVNQLLEIGRDLRIDFVLQPGEQQQTVTVTTEAQLVETTNAELGGAVQSEIIENLPLNGRNFENLLQLRPGVTQFPGGAQFGQSTNGMRALDNVYLVNGINATDPFIGQSMMNANMMAGDAGTILSVDSIDEFKTQSNPRAEFGWKPGGIINVGIKSGANAVHGTAYIYGRDTAFDARNYFDAPPNPKTPVSLEQYGGTFGGPIKKDKLFYFVNYEGQTYSIGNPFLHQFMVTQSTAGISSARSLIDECLMAAKQAPPALGALSKQLSPLSASLAGLSFNKATLGTATPTGNCTPLAGQPAGGFQGLWPVNNTLSNNVFSDEPLANQVNGGLAKIDYHINDKNSIQAMYFISEGNNLAPGTGVQPAWFTILHARAQTMSGSWTYVPNSTWVNEARFGFGHYYQRYNSNDSTLNPASYSFNGNTYVMPTGVTNPLYLGFPGISISGLTNSNGIGNGSFKIVGPDTALTFLDHVSFVHGPHSFKFGGEILPNYSTEDVTANAKGGASFSSYQNFFNGTVKSASLLTGDPARNLSNVGYALFFQDDWRIRRTVILNLGLRYELTTIVSDDTNRLANFDSTKGLVQVGKGLNAAYNGDHNNFAPRFGLAWDIKGNGKTVLRVGAGITYESQVSFNVTNGIGNFLGLRTIPTGLPLYNSGSTTALPLSGNIDLASTAYSGASATVISQAWQNFNPANPISSTGTGGLNGGPNAGLYSNIATPACGDGFTLPTGYAKAPIPCSIVGVDPNLRTPYVENWNLGIERAITSTITLDVTYVGNHGVKLFGKQDINQPQFVGGFSPGWGNPAVAGTPAFKCIASANDPTPYDVCSPSAVFEQAARPFTAPCAASIPALGVGNTSGGVFNPKNSCFSFLQNIAILNNGYSSNYNGMQVTVTGRDYHGLSFTVGYTWSHALGEASDQGQPGGGENPIPINNYGSARQQLWAPTAFDLRHRGTISLTYLIPGRDGFAQLLKGWTINTVISLQSGLPIGQADNQDDFSGSGEAIGNGAGTAGEAWDFYGTPSDFTPVHGWTDTNCKPTSGCAGGLPYFGSGDTTGGFAKCLAADTRAFSGNQLTLATASLNNLGCFVVGNSVLAPPPYGTPGNTQRNLWRDAGFQNMDFSITKIFKFGDRYRAEFRTEFFNLFNHPIFANPGGGLSVQNPQSGAGFMFSGATPDVASSNPELGSGGSRSMQLGLKFSF